MIRRLSQLVAGRSYRLVSPPLYGMSWLEVDWVARGYIDSILSGAGLWNLKGQVFKYVGNNNYDGKKRFNSWDFRLDRLGLITGPKCEGRMAIELARPTKGIPGAPPTRIFTTLDGVEEAGFGAWVRRTEGA